MKDSIFLIMNSGGVVKMLKSNNFNLAAGERAVQVEVIVPDEFFQPPVVGKIKLEVPREALAAEVTVEAGFTPQRVGGIVPRS